MLGISSTSQQLLASQEGPHSTELVVLTLTDTASSSEYMAWNGWIND
jgi:hypothetical protein